MSERDDRKLNCIIEMVRLAEKEGATIKSVTRELAKRGYTTDETNAAWSYLSD